MVYHQVDSRVDWWVNDWVDLQNKYGIINYIMHQQLVVRYDEINLLGQTKDGMMVVKKVVAMAVVKVVLMADEWVVQKVDLTADMKVAKWVVVLAVLLAALLGFWLAVTTEKIIDLIAVEICYVESLTTKRKLHFLCTTPYGYIQKFFLIL